MVDSWTFKMTIIHFLLRAYVGENRGRNFNQENITYFVCSAPCVLFTRYVLFLFEQRGKCIVGRCFQHDATLSGSFSTSVAQIGRISQHFGCFFTFNASYNLYIVNTIISYTNLVENIGKIYKTQLLTCKTCQLRWLTLHWTLTIDRQTATNWTDSWNFCGFCRKCVLFCS